MAEKLLLIEDDIDLAENICEILENAGYDVYHVVSGTRAFDMAKKVMPTLILSDIMLPKKDGYQIVKEFQDDCELKRIPFIFLTAKTKMEELRRGMDLGADDYLFKPIKADVLRRAVKTRIDKFKDMQKTYDDDDSVELLENNGVLKEDSSLFITVNKKPQFIKLSLISAISSANQYSVIYIHDKGKVTVRKSLNAWEKTLPKNVFLRIHRSAIVNTNYIVRVEKWLKSSFRIYIKGIEHPFEISKRYAARIKEHI